MSHIHSTTIEELGKSLCWVDVDIEYDLCPGEPRTHLEPGCPASIDLCGVRVTRWDNITLNGRWFSFNRIVRSAAPDWFQFLDEIIYAKVEKDWDTYCEHINKELAEMEQ